MLEVVPITLKEANAFVEQNHRHHGPTVGHKFSIGLSDGEKIVGVAIVGRPVARHLDDGWTLEVNRLCTDGTRNASICVSTLYSYITKGVFLSLTNADLPEKPKRKRPYRTVKKTGKRQNGKSIDKRPEIVDQRTTFGHWEGDTVYSKKDGSKALLVLTERLTRWEIIARIKDRTANSVIKALDQIERRFGADLFAKAFQTITFDNGGEFSDVERLERSAVRKGRRRTTAYFCHPYSSYERGSNECQNKMIRRKFPKGTDFGAVSAAAVKRAEDWINNYPREILGWKTAEICFRECLAALA